MEVSLETNIKKLSFPSIKNGQDIHSIWRFPGSFHSPVCNWIIENFTKQTDVILDPMCGSGVLPIQSYIKGRHAYGTDIDPFSILMCKAKSYPYDLVSLNFEVEAMKKKLNRIRRSKDELMSLAKKDEDDIVEKLPLITNSTHWFKNYVLNDLGKVLKCINTLKDNGIFFQACLGSIIRSVSNADPVPISGLEVTSHIKEKNNGRKIDLIGKYIEKIDIFYHVISKFNQEYGRENRPSFIVLDINKIKKIEIRPDAIIFSPPYCNAIEYYRRHRLEYMILDLWNNEEILKKSRDFIGSSSVLKSNEDRIYTDLKPFTEVMQTINAIKDRRKKILIAKYFVDTNNYLSQFTYLLQNKGYVIIVVGDSTNKEGIIPTSNLILKIAQNIGYSIRDVYEYPIKNKRMNYTRRNEANISAEKILLLHWN